MNSSHLDDDLIDLHDALAPTEDRPAPAVVLPRPTPVTEIPRWGLRPVAIRSASPLEVFF
jgi:hypothetical protein